MSDAPSRVPHAVEARALMRAFGGRSAVDGVDFTLDPGECLALFGPNGSGKTTLLRVLAGLLKPTSGTAYITGIRLPGGAGARAAVGLVAHESMLYGALTAHENVEFAARLYGVRDARNAAMASLARMHVEHQADTPVRALSRGLRQRVSIARGTVHQPQVVLLDEPFSGLDEAGGEALTCLLGELRGRGASLILVTHNLAEGLTVATHAAIMRAGRFVRFERRESLDAPGYVAAYRELITRDA